MNIELDDNLYELQKACNRYKETDPLADWVLFAISRYIATDRASPAFVKSFIAYPAEKFEALIRACLNGDKSDNGIIETAKRMILIARL